MDVNPQLTNFNSNPLHDLEILYDMLWYCHGIPLINPELTLIYGLYGDQRWTWWPWPRNVGNTISRICAHHLCMYVCVPVPWWFGRKKFRTWWHIAIFNYTIGCGPRNSKTLKHLSWVPHLITSLDISGFKLILQQLFLTRLNKI